MTASDPSVVPAPSPSEEYRPWDPRAPWHGPIKGPYDPRFDLSRVPPAKRAEWTAHDLGPRRSVALVMAVHFLTLGIATTLTMARRFASLPPVEPGDYERRKLDIAVSMLVPYINIADGEWCWLQYLIRLRFQFRLRGLAAPQLKFVRGPTRLNFAFILFAGWLLYELWSSGLVVFLGALLAAPYFISWFGLGLLTLWAQIWINELIDADRRLERTEPAPVYNAKAADHTGSKRPKECSRHHAPTPETAGSAGGSHAHTIPEQSQSSPPVQLPKWRRLLLKTLDALYLYHMLDGGERQDELSRREWLLKHEPDSAEPEAWLFPSQKRLRREG